MISYTASYIFVSLGGAESHEITVVPSNHRGKEGKRSKEIFIHTYKLGIGVAIMTIRCNLCLFIYILDMGYTYVYL